MTYYYIEKKGNQVGPLTKQELKEMRLTKTTLIWYEGLSSWTEAKNIEELNDIIIATPPPLPIKDINVDFNPIPISKNTIYEQYKPRQKYDTRYSKESDATALGLLFFIIPFLFFISGGKNFIDQEYFTIFKVISYVVSILIRIIATIWVIAIARRQNRNITLWGIFTFILPSISLIIIGQCKKLYNPNERLSSDIKVNKSRYEQFLRERGQ
jgi:hypothetical protein